MNPRVAVIACLLIAVVNLLLIAAGLPPLAAASMAGAWIALALHVRRTNTLAVDLAALRGFLDSMRTPDMDAAIAGACRARTTADLIAIHDNGVRLGDPWPSILRGVEQVLHGRGVELCPCGAPPGGAHRTTCEVAR